MTDAPETQPAFPLAIAAAAITGAAACAGVLAWIVVPVVLSGAMDVEADIVIATAVTWFATLVSLTPVVMAQHHGVMATVYGYFIGMGARFVGSLGVLVLLHLADIGAARAMLLTLVICYLPMLAVEVSFVGRHLWKLDGRLSNDSQRPLNMHTEVQA